MNGDDMPDWITTTNDHAIATGCLFNGARGQYMGEAIITLAEDLGWLNPWHPEDRNADAEAYPEVWVDAESAINAVLPDGWYAGAHPDASDFMVMPVAWWVQDDESHPDYDPAWRD